MTTQAEKAAAFAAMHERPGVFVIPNPWDAGSARMMEGMGFEALATTSSGFAQTLGRLDGQVSLDEKLEHCRVLCEASDLPVSADLENCFATDPRTAAANLVRAAEAGVVGGSIEDWDRDEHVIYDAGLAAERVQAAVEAVRTLDFPFVLTARAENLFRGSTDLDDTVARLQAFERAGADVLYAPGLRTLDEVRTVCEAVGRPVNVLSPFLRGVTVAEMGEAGARRVSIGGALARAVAGTVLRAGEEMRDRGSFEWLAGMAPGPDIAKVLAKWAG